MFRDPTLGAHTAPAQAIAPILARRLHTLCTDGKRLADLPATVCSCSLGQITHTLYEVGGQYRRTM